MPVLSSPYIDVATGKVVVTAALAFANDAGKMTGVAAIDIDASVLLKVLTAEAFVDVGGYTFVLDNDLRIVITRPPISKRLARCSTSNFRRAVAKRSSKRASNLATWSEKR